MNASSLLCAKIQEILGKTFSQLTKPQELAIPLILEGKDVLIIAPTGSGKTEAAVLPIFHKILEEKKEGREKENGFFALYITPLRALNRDMLARLERWGVELGIDIEVRHGDTTSYKRRKQALEPPDVLITTPETIQAMIPGRRLRENLRFVRHVVIDEVHELVSSKRGEQLSIALERIAEISGNFQRICLSATVGNPEEVAKFFSSHKKVHLVDIFSPKALEIDVLSPEKLEKDEKTSKQLSVDPDVISHIRAIMDEIKKNKSSLIFVNTRRAAEMLSSMINKLENNLISVHHGSLSRETRIEAEENLKKEAIKGLICTSSMELGIDIGSVEIVIQYASPKEVTRLVQRVGRASHFFQKTSRGKIIALTPDDIAESCVIARRAKAGKIENIRMKECSLDVLANQICGVLLDFGEISLNKLHLLIKRAYPFTNISFDVMQRVIEQLEKEGLVRRRKEGEERIRMSKGTREYYYENLSMIPDEKKLEVYDIASGRKICTLDESFVLNFAVPDALFVAKGETWSIVDIEEESGRIKVEPRRAKKGEIPRWEGEEIPVPFEIAQEVGSLRRKIASFIVSDSNSNLDEERLREDLRKEYGMNSDCRERVVDLIKKQIDGGYPVPTHEHIIVEAGESDKEAIINACFGHLVNETLGRLLIALLGAKLGTDISMEIDPYRIKLKSGRKINKEAIKEVLFSIEPQFIQPIIELTIKNSFLFKWEMLNVAKRFGALRKDFDRTQISADKLIKIFSGTPIEEETMKDIFFDKLDLERTEEVVRKIKSNEIKISFSYAFAYGLSTSPIGVSGYSGWRDVFASKDESLILDALKNRIMNDRVILFCVSCKKWKSIRMVKTIFDLGTKSLVCPLCKSRLIAALKPWEKEEISLVKRRSDVVKKNEKEKERVKRVYRNANLVLSHGVLAVIALAARGVGPEVASRIIRRSKSKDEDEGYEFYRNILEEERKYTRTKRFWN